MWFLLEARHHWVSVLGLSAALTLREMLSKCGANLIAKQNIHVVGGDFDWLLVLTHVVTLSNLEDVFPQSLYKFSASEAI